MVLYEYKDARGKDAAFIYYWQGHKSSQDEKADSALHTVELDDKMGGMPVQCRVVQNKEPPHFYMIFKGQVRACDLCELSMLVRCDYRPQTLLQSCMPARLRDAHGIHPPILARAVCGPPRGCWIGVQEPGRGRFFQHDRDSDVPRQGFKRV